MKKICFIVSFFLSFMSSYPANILMKNQIVLYWKFKKNTLRPKIMSCRRSYATLVEFDIANFKEFGDIKQSVLQTMTITVNVSDLFFMLQLDCLASFTNKNLLIYYLNWTCNHA